MKKNYVLLLMSLVLSVSLMAVKKVAYVTFNKTTMTATATTPANDPIIQMLKADPNLDVTVKVVLGTDVITDLATYDVIIVQESFNSGDAIIKYSGSLGIKSIPKPFIYNKTYALKTGKAITTSPATAVEAATPTITVEAGALTNDLFKACTFSNVNEITLLVDPSTDLGELGLTNSIKYLNNTTGNVISGASTLLAQPKGVTNAAIAINDIPAGSTIDTETTLSRMIAISMNFGAICANGGKNITADGLTIWRNAVYMLAGLTVPDTKVITGVNTPSISSEVMSVKYYSTSGIEIKDPSTGIFITKTAYKNGIVKTGKVVLVNHTNY
jgi:hypothetical protein